jgi:[acyl-carrier-protein] S-malonyltransferase
MSKRVGALRIVRLPTNRAFHSPLMQPVVDPWESYLASMPIRVPELPIVLGTSGRLTRDPEEIRQATVEQFTCPIQWTNVVRTLLDIGVTTALEVGDSKTLRGLNRMIDRHLEARTTTDPHDMRLMSMSGVGTSVASSGSDIT